MSDYQQTWRSLRDQEYRHYYSSDISTGLAFQIRLLREKKGWTQERLAQLTEKKQETISQWENPNYSSYTLNSLKKLAEAFDVALLVEFVPFSELVERNTTRTPERLAPSSFTEEDQALDVADSERFVSMVDIGQPRALHPEATIPDFQVPLPIHVQYVSAPSSGSVRYLYREERGKAKLYASQGKVGRARTAI